MAGRTPPENTLEPPGARGSVNARGSGASSKKLLSKVIKLDFPCFDGTKIRSCYTRSNNSSLLTPYLLPSILR